MTTIETEYGTFQGETLAEATKAARAAARAKRRELQAENRAYSAASDAAHQRGFAIHQRVARARRTGSGYLYLCEPHLSTGVEVIGPVRWSTVGGHRARYFSAVDYEHSGYEVVAVVIDSSGWAEGVITRDLRTGDESVLAVGTATLDGAPTQIAFALLEIDAAELRRLAGEVIKP